MSDTVSWSYTTVNTLRQCNRKYFFYAVMATHGRKTAVRRKAYELKQMQTLQMWQGSVVDKFMEKRLIPAITSRAVLDFTLMAEEAVILAKKQFDFSALKKYNDPSLKKGAIDEEFCILDIHELSKSYLDEEVEECYRTIREAILRIPSIQMPTGETLVDYLKGIDYPRANVMDWVIYLERAKVNPQMDFLGYQNWNPVVIDWKLSASYSSDYSRQLLICGITVYFKRLEQRDKTPYSFEKIKLYEINLYKGQVKEHVFSQDEINDMIDYINLTAEDIFLLIDNRKYEEFEITEFDQTDNQSSCRMCNFRPLCSYLLTHKNCYDEKSYLEYVRDQQYS